MTTVEFVEKHRDSISDSLHSRLLKSDDMKQAWENCSVLMKLNILDVTKCSANLHSSMSIFHRTILFESLGLLTPGWAVESILRHISDVDELFNKNTPEVSRRAAGLIVGIKTSKLDMYEKCVYELLYILPVYPRQWAERSMNFCHKIGFPRDKTERTFSILVPNPYEEVKYAPVA